MTFNFNETFDIGKTAGKSIKQKNYLKEGKFPVIDQGEDFISGYSNDESLVQNFKRPVIIFGDHTRRIKYLDFPFIPGADGTKILLPKQRIDSKFAYYQLQSKNLRDKGYARHFSELRKEQFWIPAIDEQHKIVELLEDHLSRLDAALADVKQAKVKAAQFRRSLLQAAFTGNLTGDGAGLMTTPKHWEISPLSKLVDVLDNLRVPVNSSERNKRPGSVPYYGATGQVGTIDEALFNEELLILGEDGVQFFDPNKPKAYKISGPAWVNNHAHVLRPKSEKVLQNFLLHFLNQFNYIGYANGTTRLKLTQGAMNSIPVHLPTLPEQQKIVEIIEDHLSRLDASVAIADAMEKQSFSLRRSLLQAAFSGQLTKEVASV